MTSPSNIPIPRPPHPPPPPPRARKLPPRKIHKHHQRDQKPHTPSPVALILHGLLLRLGVQILHLLLHPVPARQIRHRHDADDQAGPAREVLRALPVAADGVVLLPRVARLQPGVEDGVDDVAAQVGVDGFAAVLVGAGRFGEGEELR